MASTERIREKNDTTAKSAKSDITPTKSPITESTLFEISRTSDKIFSTSTNVTCGPEFARIVFFHDSVSSVYAETKYVFGAFWNVTGSNEK